MHAVLPSRVHPYFTTNWTATLKIMASGGEPPNDPASRSLLAHLVAVDRSPKQRIVLNLAANVTDYAAEPVQEIERLSTFGSQQLDLGLSIANRNRRYGLAILTKMGPFLRAAFSIQSSRRRIANQALARI
jgi:hypothetical protein